MRIFSTLSNSPVLVKLAAGAVPLLIVGIVLAILAAAIGPYTIPPSHTVEILLEQIGFGESGAPATEQAIIETIRLPRIILALIVGAALGVSGAVMQGLFRNPMADPGIIGVSTGGALGAVIAIALGLQAVFALALPGLAFAGAAGALALVYLIASLGGRFSMAALLLSGLALSAFIAAVISAIILFTSDLQAQREMLFWLAGGLGASTWTDIHLSAPLVMLGIAGAIFLSRDLNLLMVSEDEARTLGVRVGLTRNVLLVFTSLITGTAVAFSGAIAFIGSDRTTHLKTHHRSRSSRSDPAKRDGWRNISVSSRHIGESCDRAGGDTRRSRNRASRCSVLRAAASPKQISRINAVRPERQRIEIDIEDRIDCRLNGDGYRCGIRRLCFGSRTHRDAYCRSSDCNSATRANAHPGPDRHSGADCDTGTDRYSRTYSHSRTYANSHSNGSAVPGDQRHR